MEIGEPDFPTPPVIVEAGAKALRAGRIHYTAAAGLPELREAIALHYRERYAIDIESGRVFITPGASGALLLILSALIEAGDEVLLADPGYPCYANFVRLLGGTPTAVPVQADSNFHLAVSSIDTHWRAATRGTILASPANPTGMLIDGTAMAELIAATEARGGFVVSDEIYHGLEYGPRAHSALEYSQQVFVVNSFSKYYGMTGWRLGWTIVPEDCVETLERIAQNIFISAPTHSQLAALAAFTPANIEELERRREVLRTRRDYLVSALEGLGFVLPTHPQGAFYIYADCSKFTQDSFRFAWQLLDQAHVAITPGKDFGHHQAQTFVRFSYTASMERLSAGVERLEKFLLQHGGTRGQG